MLKFRTPSAWYCRRSVAISSGWPDSSERVGADVRVNTIGAVNEMVTASHTASKPKTSARCARVRTASGLAVGPVIVVDNTHPKVGTI
jgi:hypothetical protein